MKAWLPRLGAAIAALIIILVTLTPGGVAASPPPPWCPLCGDRVAADTIRNILLFLPLGVMLRLVGWASPRVIGSAALFSFGVELAQILIPGRDPSLTDLAANTLGAALGAGVVRAAWQAPAPRRAMLYAVAWCALLVAMLGALRLLMTPSLPASRYYGQWAPQLGHLAWYGGSVRRARLGMRELRDGPLDANPQVRTSLLAGDTLVIDATAGPPSSALAPIFSIADDLGREIVLVGADGADLVVRYRSVATWMRLEQPGIRFAGALGRIRAGEGLAIRVSRLGTGLCVEANGPLGCPGFDPRQGWAFVVPETWLGATSRRVAGALWISGLVLPACYWLALAARRVR